VSAYVFIPVEGIERFIVLEFVEELVEQREVISDLRRRLKASEAEVASLRLDSFLRSTKAGTGSGIPIDIYTALGGPDTGSTI
jgi:hypothetical protein